MFSARRRILNENEPEILPMAFDAAQGATFATVFGALKPVIDSGLTVYIFPVLTLINIYKNYVNWKKYRREINKSLGKKTSLAINILNTLAEISAVTVSSIAAFVTLTIATTFTPAVFLGITTINFVSALGKTIYHGFNWMCGESDTKKNEAHKTAFKKNAIATGVLGVMAAGLGILFFAPPFKLVFWGATVGIAAQATAATVLGGNALVGGYLAYQIHKKQKQQSPIRQQTLLAEATTTKEPLYEPAFKSAFGSKKENELRDKYKNNVRFENLKNNHVDDLARKLEVSDNKNETMLNMIQQVITALFKDLDIISVKGKNYGEIDLLSNGRLPLADITFRPRLLDPQKQKRLDKLLATLLLKEFYEGRTSLKDNLGQPIKHVGQIMKHLEENKKIENVFKSALATDTNPGGMQKLFVVAEHYDALRMNNCENSVARISRSAAAA